MLAMIFAVMMAFGAAGCGGSEPQAETEDLSEAIMTEMVEELQSYDADLDAAAAAEAGLFTIEKGAVIGGQEKWDAFMAEETDSVIVCQFSMKGGAMLDYVRRMEDGSCFVISDLTRDGYEYEEKKDYTGQSFTEIKVFENFVNGGDGTPHTLCVLTNDETLDAATFQTYWNELSHEENGAFLLFVI